MSATKRFLATKRASPNHHGPEPHLANMLRGSGDAAIEREYRQGDTFAPSKNTAYHDDTLRLSMRERRVLRDVRETESARD
jgi:hypothetical protein